MITFDAPSGGKPSAHMGLKGTYSQRRNGAGLSPHCVRIAVRVFDARRRNDSRVNWRWLCEVLSVRKGSLLLVFLTSCDASIVTPAAPPQGPAMLPQDLEVSVSGIRRLSRVELDTTINDLIADNAQAAQQYIAPDPSNPFDNDYTQQIASQALIEALEQIATEAAARVTADPQKLAAMVPCQATGPSDSACLTQFVKAFGRRAWRRALTDAEVSSFVTALQPFAVEGNDFNIAVKLVVQAMLQEPEFLYRIELGAPVDGRAGVYALNADQIATRLSYFLWGTMPPDWLFTQVDEGKLVSATDIAGAAQQLLDDPRARSRIERYHALWLGYYKLPHPADMDAAMQAESAALVDKVVFDDKSDYFDLFRSTSTYVNQLLADHYGLTGFTGGTGFAWTDYGSAPRRGLLSHGSVLSQGAKFADTSPTQRGIFIRTRLFCQVIPPPPPGVNVDSAPTSTSSTCKADRYASHATGGCAQCHQNLDPVGFGIENFDKTGAYRTHDTVPDDPSCAISGDGKLTQLPQGVATFNGVVQLEDLMMSSGIMENCVSRQVFRFAYGRNDDSADSDYVTRMTDGFKKDNRAFGQLLLSVVTDPTFTFRKDE
jgi:hypothetical protein